MQIKFDIIVYHGKDFRLGGLGIEAFRWAKYNPHLGIAIETPMLDSRLGLSINLLFFGISIFWEKKYVRKCAYSNPDCVSSRRDSPCDIH